MILGFLWTVQLLISKGKGWAGRWPEHSLRTPGLAALSQRSISGVSPALSPVSSGAPPAAMHMTSNPLEGSKAGALSISPWPQKWVRRSRTELLTGTWRYLFQPRQESIVGEATRPTIAWLDMRNIQYDARLAAATWIVSSFTCPTQPLSKGPALLSSWGAFRKSPGRLRRLPFSVRESPSL